MKHINPILLVPFKVTCRKTILAAALFCGFSMMANAQIQDGRDFSMDGFAAYEGVPILTGIVQVVLLVALVARW